MALKSSENVKDLKTSIFILSIVFGISRFYLVISANMMLIIFLSIIFQLGCFLRRLGRSTAFAQDSSRRLENPFIDRSRFTTSSNRTYSSNLRQMQMSLLSQTRTLEAVSKTRHSRPFHRLFLVCDRSNCRSSALFILVHIAKI